MKRFLHASCLHLCFRVALIHPAYCSDPNRKQEHLARARRCMVVHQKRMKNTNRVKLRNTFFLKSLALLSLLYIYIYV